MDIYRKAFYQEISQLHQPIINWSVLFIWVQWLTYSWNLGNKIKFIKVDENKKDFLEYSRNLWIKQNEMVDGFTIGSLFRWYLGMSF